MKITLRSHGCLCKGDTAGMSIENVPANVKSLKIYGFPGEITMSVTDDPKETACDVNTRRTEVAYYMNMCHDFADKLFKEKENSDIHGLRDELLKDFTFKMFTVHLPGDSYIDKDAFYPVKIMVCHDNDAKQASVDKTIELSGPPDGPSSIKLSELIPRIMDKNILNLEGTLDNVEFEVISCSCGPQMPFPADPETPEQTERVQKIIEAATEGSKVVLLDDVQHVLQIPKFFKEATKYHEQPETLKPPPGAEVGSTEFQAYFDSMVVLLNDMNVTMSYTDAVALDAIIGKYLKWGDTTVSIMTLHIQNKVATAVYEAANKPDNAFAQLQQSGVRTDSLQMYVKNRIKRLYLPSQGQPEARACMFSDIITADLDPLIMQEARKLYNVMYPCVSQLWEIPDNDKEGLPDKLADFIMGKVHESMNRLITYVKAVNTTKKEKVGDFVKALFGKSPLYDVLVQKVIRCVSPQNTCVAEPTWVQQVTGFIDTSVADLNKGQYKMDADVMLNYLKEDANEYLLGLNVCDVETGVNFIDDYINKIVLPGLNHVDPKPCSLVPSWKTEVSAFINKSLGVFREEGLDLGISERDLRIFLQQDAQEVLNALKLCDTETKEGEKFIKEYILGIVPDVAWEKKLTAVIDHSMQTLFAASDTLEVDTDEEMRSILFEDVLSQLNLGDTDADAARAYIKEYIETKYSSKVAEPQAVAPEPCISDKEIWQELVYTYIEAELKKGKDYADKLRMLDTLQGKALDYLVSMNLCASEIKDAETYVQVSIDYERNELNDPAHGGGNRGDGGPLAAALALLSIALLSVVA